MTLSDPLSATPGFKVTVHCDSEYFKTVHLSSCIIILNFQCNVLLTRDSSAMAEPLVRY